MGGPGSGGYPADTPEEWLAWLDEVPEHGTVSACLKAHGRNWGQFQRMRERHPEIDVKYQTVRRALAGRLAEASLEDLQPDQLLSLPDPKLASAAAALARERAVTRRWLAERHGRADYGEQVTHAHDVAVRAVIALPELGTVAPMPAVNTSTSPLALPASQHDSAQVATAEVVSVEAHDATATD